METFQEVNIKQEKNEVQSHPVNVVKMPGFEYHISYEEYPKYNASRKSYSKRICAAFGCDTRNGDGIQAFPFPLTKRKPCRKCFL